ncbi:MAG: transglycosylase domain-containing protein, partial [Euzebyales bacterium]|nr:transglycosylase domain-containing protein [Euzebyales bacterium]
MPQTRFLDAVADRLGHPALWGGVVTRAVVAVVSITSAGVLLAASVAPSVSLAAAAVDTVDRQVLSFPPMPEAIGVPRERSVVLARDGSVLAVLHDVENRKLVALAAVPEHVQQAVIATEDAGFLRHRGVDWRAIVRAAVGNFKAGEVTSGASTITQQLVKAAVLRDSSRTVGRKLREAVYATELERRLTKRQILEEYLNLAYFGHGIYGIGTAAEYYFDRRVRDLTVAQGALLAGMLRAPLVNDPIGNPKAARQRRNIVLRQMTVAGFLSQGERRRLARQPLGLQLSEVLPDGNSFFVAYVRHLLKQDPALGPSERARDLTVLRGGLRIHTTLDPRLQRIADRSIRRVLRGPRGPQAALTALDPRSGEILAIAGGPKPYGRGKGHTEVTPAVRGLGSSGRQAGSAFKAFQVVAALEDGISPTYSFAAGARYKTRSRACRDDGRQYTPGNYADAAQGRLDMAAATAKSSNTYFTRLVDVTGPDKLADAANRMGIPADFSEGGGPFCSHVLGTKEVFGLDMAAGYGTLANSGVHCRPFAIAEVSDRQGRTIVRNGGRCERVVERGVADRATRLLRGPIEFGTAAGTAPIGRPAAGKTGTTNNYGDAWFVGYVPQLVA